MLHLFSIVFASKVNSFSSKFEKTFQTPTRARRLMLFWSCFSFSEIIRFLSMINLGYFITIDNESINQSSFAWRFSIIDDTFEQIRKKWSSRFDEWEKWRHANLELASILHFLFGLDGSRVKVRFRLKHFCRLIFRTAQTERNFKQEKAKLWLESLHLHTKRSLLMPAKTTFQSFSSFLSIFRLIFFYCLFCRRVDAKINRRKKKLQDFGYSSVKELQWQKCLRKEWRFCRARRGCFRYLNCKSSDKWSERKRNFTMHFNLSQVSNESSESEKPKLKFALDIFHFDKKELLFFVSLRSGIIFAVGCARKMVLVTVNKLIGNSCNRNVIRMTAK